MSRYRDADRCTGRTTRMLQALPEGGCIVVVHDSHFKPYVLDMLVRLRGRDFCKSVRLVSLEQAEGAVRGSRYPVFVDHHVSDFAFSQNRRVWEQYRKLLDCIQAGRVV